MKTEKRKTGKSKDGREMHYSAGVIVECDGKYLMEDRKNIPYGFACPAGHVDEGEDPKDAGIREVFEETGVKLEGAELLFEEEISWNYCKSAQVHYWYLFKAKTNYSALVFNEEETKSLNWYIVEEIKKLNLEPVWKYWRNR